MSSLFCQEFFTKSFFYPYTVIPIPREPVKGRSFDRFPGLTFFLLIIILVLLFHLLALDTVQKIETLTMMGCATLHAMFTVLACSHIIWYLEGLAALLTPSQPVFLVHHHIHHGIKKTPAAAVKSRLCVKQSWQKRNSHDRGKR